MAPHQDLEIIVSYPSGKMEWVEITTGSNGTFETTIQPTEDGQIRVSVDNPPGSSYAPTRTGETIVNTRYPGPALADYTWETNFFFGGLFFTEEPSFGSNFQAGFRFSYRLRQDFMLEFETNASHVKDTVDTGMLGSAQVQLLYQPVLTGKVIPFALLGMGYGWFSRINDWAGSSTITYGAGLKFRVNSKVQARLDARMNNFLKSSMNADNLQINWGVSFLF